MTKKQHFNLIIRKAETINRHLEKLRSECKACIDEICEHADNYDYDDYYYQLALLEEALGNLSCFDLEDSIPDKASYEY